MRITVCSKNIWGENKESVNQNKKSDYHIDYISPKTIDAPKKNENGIYISNIYRAKRKIYDISFLNDFKYFASFT